MPQLSERDLSSVQKFFDAMHAALAATESRKAEAAGTAAQSASLPPATDTAAATTAGVAPAPEVRVAGKVGTAERRVWAETASVFWRIASRQQTQLLSYVATDATRAMCILCDGLLDYVLGEFESLPANASPPEVVACASSLGGDHIFFFIDAFCSLKSCISMMGGEEARGKDIHAHVCETVVRQQHFRWMTRVFCAFCEEARRMYMEKGSITGAAVTATREVLRCVLHCCTASTACARALVYTEPRPLAANLLHGLRLRIATSSLIRPFVRHASLQRGSSGGGDDFIPQRKPTSKCTLAERLASGRKNAYDEISREALAVAVAAVEKAAAYESPAVVTGLCLIIELSSRAVTPAQGEAGKLSLSVQVAMYENMLAAWDALSQLLQSSGEGASVHDLAAHREVILQQLLKHDLAGCVRCILRYCPALVECEPMLFRIMRTQCTPPIARSKTVAEAATVAVQVGNPSQHQGGSSELTNESLHNRGGIPSSLTDSIHMMRALPREFGASLGSNLAKSLWMGIWPGTSRASATPILTTTTPSTVARQSTPDEEQMSSPDPRMVNDSVSTNPQPLLRSSEHDEKWWFENKTFVMVTSSLTEVLREVFTDVTMPLSLRLSSCTLLSQITMRSSSAFSELEGRLVVRAFLSGLRHLEQRLQSAPVTPGVPIQDDDVIFSRTASSTGGEFICKSGSPESVDENAMYAVLARQILSALWQTYHVLHEPPLSGEVVDLIELPLLLLRWCDEAATNAAADGGVEAYDTLKSLLSPVVRLWYTSLISDDDEDINTRSHEVLMEMLAILLKMGSIPAADTEKLDVSGGADTTPATSVSVSAATVVHLGTESIASAEIDATVLEASQVKCGGTVLGLCDIFTILLKRNTRFLSTHLLEILFALLWANDTRLSKLGRRCITSSLDFGEVYAVYAEVIRNADPSLLLQLLPLFSLELVLSKVPADAKHERRVRLFQYGCVDAVITVLEHLLLVPHHVGEFPRLIQQLFRFLSVVESPQGSGPHLAETRLVQMFAESLVSLEGAEFFILISQAVLNAATSKYDDYRNYSRRVQMHGHFSLSIPNYSVEKPVFVDLIPPLLRHAHEHAVELESNLLSVVHLVLKKTAKVRSDAMLQWVLEARQTALLPYLELDAASADHQLPYVGRRDELESFWAPILREAPEYSELRFNCTGGIVVTMGQWPEKGFSISASFRFEEIYSTMNLFGFVDCDVPSPSPASIYIAGGDSIHIMQEGKKMSVNESQALQGLAPRRWVHCLVVMSVAHTVSVYLNANRVGTCTLPYFRPHTEVIINIGFVNDVVHDALFSIGDVSMWDEELTAPQVEAYVAMAPYQPNVCKMLVQEVPRELSESREALPVDDRIAAFVPYESRDTLLLSTLHAQQEKYPIMAKLTGNYAEPPKGWIDYRDLFLSRGGLLYLLDWIGQSNSAEELQDYVALACSCIRSTTTSGTMDWRTYALLGHHLCRLAHLITPAVCDSLLDLAATQVSVNDEQHPFIINRLVFDHILRNMALISAMPVECAEYIMVRVEKMFTFASCRFARRNANYVLPFRFVDSVLNSLVYEAVSLPFSICARVISCVKQIMIACDFEPNIVNAVASTPAMLTPAEMEVVSLLQPSVRVVLPKARFAQIRVSHRVACDITLMILRSLVECCSSAAFITAFGLIVDLNWFAACVSRFADSASVVYAARLFFEALQCNALLRNEVMQNPAVVVAALSPHSFNEDLVLLLLSLSVGAAKRIDVLASKHPLLEQLDGILHLMVPEPDAVAAPIFAKVFTLHLNATLLTPSCFRPCGISTVMQRRLHCSYRLHKYFSLARVCSRLMLLIEVKRLLPPQSGGEGLAVATTTTAAVAEAGASQSSTLSSPGEGKQEDVMQPGTLPFTTLRRHRGAWMVLRVCVRLWRTAKRSRYQVLLQRVSNTEPLRVLDKEVSGTLFVLHTLQRLSSNPNLFVSLTLSPYQTASLAFFGTFLQRAKVLANTEELERAQWGQAPVALSADIAGASTTSTIAAPMAVSDGRASMDVGSVDSVTRSQGGSSVLQSSPTRWGGAEDDDDDEVEYGEEEDAYAEEEKGPQPSLPLSPPPLQQEQQQESRLAQQEQLQQKEEEVEEIRQHTRRRASLLSWASSQSGSDEDDDGVEHRLGSILAVVAPIAEDDSVHREMRSQMYVGATIGSIEELSVPHASVVELLRDNSVEVLRCTITSSLHTLPVTTSWVGGQKYGCCGGLLFQVMLIMGATSSTEEAASTLTHFFMQQVLRCVKRHEHSLESSRHMPEMASSKTMAITTTKGLGRRGGVGNNSTSSNIIHSSSASMLQQGSVSDVFFFNVCRFNDLLVDLLSFNVMELSHLSPYFVSMLTTAASSWPRRSLQQLRSQVVKGCIAVLNKPSTQEVTPELMELIYLMFTRAMTPQWIMKDMLECLLRVLFRIYAALPPTSMNDEETTRRKSFVILCIRHMMHTYSGSKELQKALTARTLTHRFSLYKEFTATLLGKDEAAAIAAFDIFCRNNMTTVDTLMSGRPKTKADIAFKSLLKDRSEYIKRIKVFNEAYTKTTELKEQHKTAALIDAYTSRFSSQVGRISSLSLSQVHWLTPQCCSFEQSDPRARLLHYMDTRGNHTKVLAGWGSEDAVPTVVGADTCEQQLNHISALVPPFTVRCRPYVYTGCVPFIDRRCDVSHSAVSLLRYLLEPNEVLRFISNGFRVNGIHVTPCLVLLTDTTLKLIGFSHITESGDIVLCKCEHDEEEAGRSVTCVMTRPPKRRSNDEQTALSFALSMTSKLQRFLTDTSSGSDRRRRRESEACKDGTKVAQSVRQSTGHAYRDLFWVYRTRNIRSVRTALYMHQDTAVRLELMYDDGLLLSVVDAQQSMNTRVRDAFLAMLKEVLGTQRYDFYDHSQRGASIRSMLIRWAAGSVSTFDYLKFLNCVAGRTIIDFNQYPVYPWVLADYKSEEVALDLPASYRDFSLPMGAQTETRRQAVARLYKQMMEMQTAEPDMEVVEPFHHGTHYSTSGGVLHYLIRAEPYTTFARIFQGGDFDVATRLFDSIEASFQSCVNGPTDCKELTPEFYSNSMFLVNVNHCIFGEKSDGSTVNDVRLPPWAKGSTQVFTAIMRYALESSAVVNNIHRWIDLIFGVCRRGRLAVERYNVFQRMTYGEEVVRALNRSHDSRDIDVIIAEVDNFGQTPMQLFQERHPAQRELEPCDSPSGGGSAGAGASSGGGAEGGGNSSSSGGSGGGSGGVSTRSGHTYNTAFQEQMPKVVLMVMHALDSPQTWFVFEDPAPGIFQATPAKLSEMFRIHDNAVLDFATLRGGTKMCCYRYIVPVDDADYMIAWSEGEHLLMRFDVTSGRFLSLLRYTSALKAPVSVSVIRVSCRETLILLGSNSGTLYCLTPSSEDGMLLLSSTLCHHTHSIAGFASDTHYGRVISYTTCGADFPIVWCVQQQRTQKLHRLDTTRMIPNATPGDRIVVAAALDPRCANSIVVTRRHLLIFDRYGEPYGIGALPMSEVASPHLEDETGQVGFAVDGGHMFVASMTTVTTYDTLEWCSGIQLLLTGHQDGSVSLWRAVRLPPDSVQHGRIVRVEYHGPLVDSDQRVRLGAVTAIRQEQRDVPVFHIGYHSGAVKVLRFDSRVAETTKTAKS
ncbi:putative neurobeachin/beige protein [Trypanosoma grayi]|uniref:putative neurobeachin/beige protein n=1 Tax=Trypanosoma grayi TaxID=71804 RepID=UPI0004F3F240|nr:putative neurobeachin/beige protein [Trypanosoma grayi]KEG10334.1 putative neurobeachin/beige protein [Trypanosoma grayi]